MSRFGYTIFLVLVNLCLCLSPNAFANFAPFAALSANSTEVLTGQAVSFSSEGSVDPDNRPQPISFLWTFGDGESSSERNPLHSFARSGAYTVSVEVSDGADQSIASITIVVLEHPTT